MVEQTVYYNVNEAAEILGMPVKRVYSLCRQRKQSKFPAHKQGKSWYIHREKLLEWAARVSG